MAQRSRSRRALDLNNILDSDLCVIVIVVLIS